MTRIEKSALVPVPAQRMYELVLDVERYPDFLPWCRATQLHYRRDDEMSASLDLARGPVKKRFTTINALHPFEQVDMRLAEGPFKHLNGSWRFQDLGGQGCRVSLDLEFEFSNRLTAMTLGPVFNEVANSLVDAFCQHAISQI